MGKKKKKEYTRDHGWTDAPMFEKNPVVSSWMSLGWIKNDKVSTAIAQCAGKHDEVPPRVFLQWSKCAVPYRLPYMLVKGLELFLHECIMTLCVMVPYGSTICN